MAIKKNELYSSLWKSCDELRGGMDASQYKDYVLVLLVVKYVSDKYVGQKDVLLDVPKGGRIADMVAPKGDPEIIDKMDKIVGCLAEARTRWTVSPTRCRSMTTRRSTSEATEPRVMTFWGTLTNT